MDVQAPYLDHVSLAIDGAEIEAMGFALNETPGDGSHARVLLDRSYFEVTPPGSGNDLAINGWFLRPNDLGEAAGALRSKGIPTNGPNRYQAADGIWLDVTVTSGDEPSLPTLTRRVDQHREDWPPALEKPHPNGSTRISAVHVRMADPTPLVEMLEALGARTENRRLFELGGGGQVLIEESTAGPDGVVAVLLERAEQPPLRLEPESLSDR